MALIVKISDAEMNAIKAAAELNHRSVSSQAKYWIRLGRAVEQDPRFGQVQIEEALTGRRPLSSLTDEQQDPFLDRCSAGRPDSWEGFFALDATTPPDFMNEADRNQYEQVRDPFASRSTEHVSDGKG